MDLLLPIAVALAAAWMLKGSQQRARISLLAQFLSRYRIEKNMETVTQGYLRALGEPDPVRQEQVWGVLAACEQELCAHVTRLAADFAAADAKLARVSKLPMWAPFATSLLPSFDMREALAIHARGIRRAIESSAPASARARAFTISALLLLMQHTCHWFCKSRLVASARMLSRHRTSYDQLVAAVQPQTRADYLALGGPGTPG
mgnify:CR=1 FL=1